MQDFDIVLLRTFVAVVDAGGFSRAGQRLRRGQSTVSQQIKRLEDQTGAALLDRSAHHLRLTEDGERLLSYARRILALSTEAAALFGGSPAEEVVRIGVTEDYAVDRLPALLSRFAREREGRVRLHVRCGMSRDLLADLDGGDLDIALVKEVHGDRSPLALWHEPLHWVVGQGADAVLAEDPLPLVAFPQGCCYRDQAIHELETQGRAWRIAYTSPNLAGVQAAVIAGLGVALLDRQELPADARRLMPDDGFPAMPDARTALYARSGRLGPAAQEAADLLRESVDGTARRAAA